ncbi:hypothetical protein N665_0107s0003 [Sinapis alba]|nr:hypothetical protein N665_0107s0003 [Sinapis alba]
MPAQWGMDERVTANDLGNGKFFFNFTSEEDLNSVLRQGVPLHLWTVTNLKKIGARLGVVDTLELAEGRMLVNVDSRKSLKFSRKVESPIGDEVTIEIKYDKLFKHFSLCGMLTHEKELCPSVDMKAQHQAAGARHGVFARVQPPLDLPQRFIPQEDLRSNSSRTWLPCTESSSLHRNLRDDKGGWKSEMENTAYSGTHSSRIERWRNEYSRGARYGGIQPRYGGIQSGKGPYDRVPKQSWRNKTVNVRHLVPDMLSWIRLLVQVMLFRMINRGRILQEHLRAQTCLGKKAEAQDVLRVARALSLPTDRELAPLVWGDQVIGALKDMDLDEQQVGEMMDCEVQEDDFLGLELKEMEDKIGSSDPKGEETSVKPVKLGNKANVPRGFPNKKIEFLQRGSPRKRLIHSHAALMAGETGKSRRQYESSKKQRVSKSKGDGLMSSRNSSDDHL